MFHRTLFHLLLLINFQLERGVKREERGERERAKKQFVSFFLPERNQKRKKIKIN